MVILKILNDNYKIESSYKNKNKNNKKIYNNNKKINIYLI